MDKKRKLRLKSKGQTALTSNYTHPDVNKQHAALPHYACVYSYTISYARLLSKLTPSIYIIFTEFKEVDGCSSKCVYM